MGTRQKAFTIAMWGLVVLGMIALIAMTRRRDEVRRELPDNDAVRAGAAEGVRLDQLAGLGDEPIDFELKAPSFQLIDQTGEPFHSDRLQGKVWTAMLFFSSCPGVCPGMKARIMKVQGGVTDERVNFVSFSVDPERDTPEVLARYAESAGAGADRWHMLTGTPEQMHAVAAGIGLPYDVAANHSSRILLVDQQGVIRRVYSSSSEKQMKQLTTDAANLARDGKL